MGGLALGGVRTGSAEQIVDSLFVASGKKMNIEPLSFDADGKMVSSTFLNLGVPRRAWELLSLSNERDRPSLSMPRAQAVVDVLEAFGWNGARQSPLTDRETDANLLQPGTLANGPLAARVSRLSDDSRFTSLALKANKPEELAEEIYLAFLSRLPTKQERIALVKRLEPGFQERIESTKEMTLPPRAPRVSWNNHLNDKANQQMLDYAKAVRDGEPPTKRLGAEWRERMEDVVWSVFNLPEFVWIP